MSSNLIITIAFLEINRPKIALEKMFAPPTEKEMKSYLQELDDNIDIQPDVYQNSKKQKN